MLGLTKLTPKEIARLLTRSVGIADLAQYLQVVLRSSSPVTMRTFTCGGSPTMNKVMMDGMVLYNPFHSIGLFQRVRQRHHPQCGHLHGWFQCAVRRLTVR
ncbi:MAG: hypothetical protein IPP83_12680 [Flavobacteriales bacterium]|nr:hypothetical protein [Flavobacteriales bacterium]